VQFVAFSFDSAMKVGKAAVCGAEQGLISGSVACCVMYVRTAVVVCEVTSIDLTH
jgi:hypothetical protein